MANVFDNLFGPPARVGGPGTLPPGGDDIDRYGRAIMGIESSGGNYGLIGPRHPTLGRALGAYQIMEANLPTWLSEAGLPRMTAEEFLANRDAQDRVFRFRFGSYLERFGNPTDAAEAWFAGPGNVGSGRNPRDLLGTSVSRYRQMFLERLGDTGTSDIVTGALPGPATTTGTRTMGSPFDALFGEPERVRVERLQQAGADRRLGTTLGAAENVRADEQNRLRVANETWQNIWRQYQSEVGPPDPALLNDALRRFVMTPEFMLLGRENATAFQNIFRQIQTAPNQPFVVPATGGTVMRDTPGGVGVERVVPPTVTPPRQPGPLDTQRGAEIGRWFTAGQTIGALEPVIDGLERLLVDRNASGAQFTQWWDSWRARFGLPASSTASAVAEALRTRLVQAMHEAGMGPMTDSDRAAYERALGSIGTSREANAAILEITRRTMRTIQDRSSIAGEALEANTPEAVSRAFAAVNDPTLMRGRSLQREAAWVAETFRVAPEVLNVNTPAELRLLTQHMQRAYGGQLPARAERFLRELAMRIDASGG